MYHPTRGGVRGGTDQFSWETVKTDKHRENYLGHSVMAPVGRWQKGKDLSWYAKERKGEDSAETSRKSNELMAIKKAEEDAMMIALGFKPAKKEGQNLAKEEMAEVLKRGHEERSCMNIERIQGVGTESGGAAMQNKRQKKTHNEGISFESQPPHGSTAQRYDRCDIERSGRMKSDTRSSKSSKKHKKEKHKKNKKKKKQRKHSSESESESGSSFEMRQKNTADCPTGKSTNRYDSDRRPEKQSRKHGREEFSRDERSRRPYERDDDDVEIANNHKRKKNYFKERLSEERQYDSDSDCKETNRTRSHHQRKCSTKEMRSSKRSQRCSSSSE